MNELADQILLQQLSAARAWAWSEYHRYYDARWLPTREVADEGGDWDWAVPEWLSSNVEPHLQPWFIAPAGTEQHPKPDGGR